VLRRLADLVARIHCAFDRRAGLLDPQSAERVLRVLESDHRPGPEDEDRLGDLAAAFALTEFDELLLTVAVAPELNPTFSIAYALLQADSAALRPSAGLALELAGASRTDADARDRLAPGAPLRACDLLEVVGDAPFPARSLRVPERVAGHLAGELRLDVLVEALLVAPVAVQVPESQQLGEALQAGSPLVWVTAVPGSAGLGMAAAAFDALGAASLAIDLRRRPPGVSVTDAVRVAVREAGMLLSGLVVAGADLLVSEGGTALLGRLERSPVPVVAVASEPWNAEWSLTIPHLVVAPMPGPELREQLWHEHVGGAVDTNAQEWAALVGLRLSPEQIARAARHARSGHGPDQPLDVTDLRESARFVGSSGVKGTARVRPNQSFADLVLPAMTMGPLREIVRWATHRDAVLGQGPVGGKHGQGRGITALFTGSTGTGKTLAAHVIAGELGLDLQTVDLSVVVDKYIGETEKRLEEVLSAAENLNAVLLFDEADALFGSRADVREARDRYANQEVSYLLQRIERFGGIAILTTNLPGNIDTAFSRRLNFVVSFPDPDKTTRQALWRSHLGALAATSADDPVDVEQLAEQLEVAGGDIRNIVLTAAYTAAHEAVPVGMRHVRSAAEREYRKLGRMPPSTMHRQPPSVNGSKTTQAALPNPGSCPSPT
jgi:hypothetical protein